LPDQPILYPVLNEDYATRIARDWNVKASGAGDVTKFLERPGVSLLDHALHSGVRARSEDAKARDTYGRMRGV